MRQEWISNLFKKEQKVSSIYSSIGHTDIGTRETNEDYFIRDDKNGIYIIADGLGSSTHKKSDLVSILVSNAAYHSLKELKKDIDEGYGMDIEDEIEDILVGINDMTVKMGLSKHLKNAATTLSFILMNGYDGYLGHSGDSFVKIVEPNDNKVIKLTEDNAERRMQDSDNPYIRFAYSFGNDMIGHIGKKGIFEKGTHYQTDRFNLKEHSFLFLGTDGLDFVTDKEILESLNHNNNLEESLGYIFGIRDNPQRARRIIDVANRRYKFPKAPEDMLGRYDRDDNKYHASRDNATGIIVEVL